MEVCAYPPPSPPSEDLQATPSYRRCGVAAALGTVGTGARNVGSSVMVPGPAALVGNCEYSPSEEAVNAYPALLGMSV